MALTRGSRVRLKWHGRIADLVEYAFRRGCRFDGWGEELKFEVWMRGIEELGVDRYSYLRTIPLDARLPWDHIDVGVTADFLKKEYRKALLHRTSPPCGKPFRTKVRHTNLAEAAADKRRLVCYDCGIACDLSKMREERMDFLTRLGAVTPAEAAGECREEEPGLEEIRDQNQRPRTRVENAAKISYRLRFTKLGVEQFISHLDVVRLLLTESPTARPGEVFRWITGASCAPQEIVRTGLFSLGGKRAVSPLELEELRLKEELEAREARSPAVMPRG